MASAVARTHSLSLSTMLSETDTQLLVRLSTEDWIGKSMIVAIHQDIDSLKALARTSVGEPIHFKIAMLEKELLTLMAASRSINRVKLEVIDSLRKFMPI